MVIEERDRDVQERDDVDGMRAGNSLRGYMRIFHMDLHVDQY